MPTSALAKRWRQPSQSAIGPPPLSLRPTRAAMLAAFVRACQYEWLFWDGAYQRRSWPSFD